MGSSVKLKNTNGNTLTLENKDTNAVDKTVDLGKITTYVDTVEDLANIEASAECVIVRDKDRGGVFNAIGSTTANAGTIFDGSGCSWERQFSGSVNVKWFGAKGDGVTDDKQAIQNALDSLTFMNSGFAASISAYGAVNTLVFPDGKYLVTSPLVLASTEGSIRCNIEFGVNALLLGSSFATSSDFVLTIKGLFGASLSNVQVHGVGCNAFKLVESRNSILTNCGFGSDTDYSMFLGGVIFNNVFNGTRINQNVSINGATYGLYWDAATIDTSVSLDGAGAPINLFNGFYSAGNDNAIFIAGNKDKSIDSWSAGAIKFSTLEIEGFNISGITAIDIGRQITFENAWCEGTGSNTYDHTFKNCTQVSMNENFMGTSSSVMYFEGCNRISIESCYSGGNPVFRGKNGTLSINNCTFNSPYARITHLINQADFSSKINTPTFDRISIDNVVIKSYYTANIDTIVYNDTTKVMSITTSGTTNIDAQTEYVYVDNMVVSYVNVDNVSVETNLVGIFKVSSYISTSSFSIYIDVHDFLSTMAFVDGNISELTTTIDTTSPSCDYSIIPTPRCIGAGLRCDITDSATYTAISPLGIKESLITVNDVSNFPLLYVVIDGTSLPSDTENDYILSFCVREKMPTPSVTENAMEYIRTGGSFETNPYGEFGQTVTKDGIRYVIFSSRVVITPATTLNRLTINYANAFDVGSEIVFGGAVVTKGTRFPVFK